MTKIENLVDIENTLAYFNNRLNWPISQDSPAVDPYEANWEYYPEDLGLKDSDFAKITSLQQMRPLTDNQDWAVFFVEFDANRMQISVLRKILGALIFNKRNSDHKIWNKENLLFVCFWGIKDEKTIGFIHFNESVKGLPTLKALYFQPKKEELSKLTLYESYLAHLHWEYCEKCDAWTTEWKKAFTTEYGQIIRDTTRLTKELAHSAQTIRKQVLEVLEVENENGYVHKLLNKFKNNLVHDMDENSFADMYAQTISYGLFSARCLNAEEEIFDPIKAIDNIPDTNPFLRQLLKEGLDNQRGNLKNSIPFDELELNSIIDLLQNTDIKSIVAEFNRQTRNGFEDPVIHFYEDFLTEYDKDTRMDRGVFYTPLPVVNFLVRSVDQILKTEFDIEDGLACDEKIQIEETNGRGKAKTYKVVPKVQILDPATGTGTFLRQTILKIKENFDERNKNLSKDQLASEWNKYVILSLLHRIYGFELMMAPYAVAHMKLAMALKDTGYDFKSNSRLKVFLTNSLEEPGDSSGQRSLFEEDSIAVEATQANAVKKDSKINIVIGNPPYNKISNNKGDWILKLIDDYKIEPGAKEKLKEKKNWLGDDYVKFIRLGEQYLKTSEQGILAFINNHSFIDNTTFRGMRWHLLREFDAIYIINLSARGKELEYVENDENVFNIKQGVSINIFVKKGLKSKNELGKVFYTSLLGEKKRKFEVMQRANIYDLNFEEINYSEPYYFFASKSEVGKSIYNEGFKIDELMKNYTSGIVTAADDFTLADTKQGLLNHIKDLEQCTKEKLKEKYSFGKNYIDNIYEHKNDLVIDKKFFAEVAYRPFDDRWTYYDRNNVFIWRSRSEIMDNYFKKENYGLISAKLNSDKDADYYFITDKISEMKLSARTTQCYNFPLYIYNGNTLDSKKRIANLDQNIIKKIGECISCKFISDHELDDKKKLENFNPLDILDYIYAVLYTPSYRIKYKEFLKIDFPRIPYPKNREQFFAFVEIGEKLRELHLMKSPLMEQTSVVFRGNLLGSEEVTSKKYDNGKVWINKTEYFDNVPAIAWNFYIGGYQVADKYLKDRKGRKLSAEEITHYTHIIKILMETDRLMKQLDTMWEV